MKRFAVCLLIVAFLLTGSAIAMAQGSVFKDMRETALREGLPEDGYSCSYRKINDKLVYGLAASPEGDGVAILVNDLDSGIVTIVGYYPGNEDGEYLSGALCLFGFLDRQVVSKEEAEKRAAILFEEYKKGTPCTINSWQGLPEPTV